MLARLHILAHLLLTCVISIVCSMPLQTKHYATEKGNKSIVFIIAQFVCNCQRDASPGCLIFLSQALSLCKRSKSAWGMSIGSGVAGERQTRITGQHW